MKKKSLIAIMSALLTFFIPTPFAEAISIEQTALPPATGVLENQATAIERGCEVRTYGETIDVPPGKPYQVFASDSPFGSVLMCSPRTRETLTPQAGEVRGSAIVGAGLGAISGSLASSATKGVVDGVTDVATIAADGVVQQIKNVLLFMISAAAGMAHLVAQLSIAAVNTALLSTNTFITNPIVTSLWPFVQGIANLGFMFALLFIALATSLQLKSFSAAKMIPRLLAAALLINFSLVIAAVILDFVQLLMAIAWRIIMTDSIEVLQPALLISSNLLEIAQATYGNGDPVTWNSIVTTAVKFILILAIAISFLLLAIGLLIRYLILLLLLVVAPMPYLALAFPGMGSLAKQWWQLFFKYALYGPFVLFMIIILVRSSDSIEAISSDPNLPLVNEIIHVILIVGIAVLAVLAPRRLGGSITNQALDFAYDRGKRASKGIAKRGVGAAAYVPSKAGAAAVKTGKSYGKNISKDASQYVKQQYKTRAPQWAQPGKRDSKNNLLPGQKSAALRGMEAVFGKVPKSPEQQREIAEANRHTAGHNEAMSVLSSREEREELIRNSPAYRSDNLRKSHIAESRTANERRNIREYGTTAQAVNLYSHKEVVSKMGEDEKNEIFNLEVNAPTNLATDTKDAAANEENRKANHRNKTSNAHNRQIILTVQKTLDKIADEQNK